MYALQHQVTEWAYSSGQKRQDPFNELELDVIIRHADGTSWRVPAYWAGGQEWRVRFAPPQPGTYETMTVCSDPAADLHGVRGRLEVAPSVNANPLFTHGPLRVAASRRTLEFADGTPFFWLGDTWWMGLCQRLSWPEDFQELTADRVAKGFTVVQIVAGLYPDMPSFDPRGSNEAGFPWEEGYTRINPAYFDMADLRIRWLVREGLVPCIVGSWGYYLPVMGIEKLKQHWRTLIARWSAYPVVWCLAGEGAMPYYLSADKEGERQAQIAGWTEVGRYVRATDPYGRLITIHPTRIGRDQVTDDAVLDFDMLQTGHGGFGDVPNAVATVRAEYARTPTMPVIVGEANYEGILHLTQAEVQRLTFWATMLSGAGGYTYGANGIWQVNTPQQPFGPSPYGATWGNTPWREAMRLPGGTQLGLARLLLERYPWERFEPHPEWVHPIAGPENVKAPFAAGIPGQVRIIYLYDPSLPWAAEPIVVVGLEPDVHYHASYWDPRSGAEHDLGAVRPDAQGRWPVPLQPTMEDWVLVLETDDARRH